MQRAYPINKNNDIEIARNDLRSFMTSGCRYFPMDTIRDGVLDYFDLSEDSPWKIKVKRVSESAFAFARDQSRSFINYDSYKTWKDHPEKLVYKSFYSVRIYPSASCMLGFYGILMGIMNSSVPNPLMNTFHMEPEMHNDNETALEKLENLVTKLTEDLAWKGTKDDLAGAFV
jgi:hypothetical protein